MTGMWLVLQHKGQLSHEPLYLQQSLFLPAAPSTLVIPVSAESPLCDVPLPVSIRTVRGFPT